MQPLGGLPLVCLVLRGETGHSGLGRCKPGVFVAERARLRGATAGAGNRGPFVVVSGEDSPGRPLHR